MKNILLLNGDTDFNLGDAAIQTALCHHITSLSATTTITVTSSKAVTSSTLPGVRVIRRGPRGFRDLLRCAAASDLVVVGGGGLFQDDDSRIKMPFWCGLLTLLKTANSNLVGYSIGAGPLTHFESRQCAGLACALLKCISVRDRFAHQSLAQCTQREIQIVPDPAFMLTPASSEQADRLVTSCGLDTTRPIIGVSLRRWFHRRGGFVPHRVRAALHIDRDHGAVRLDGLLEQLALALSALANQLSASILLLPTYAARHENDTAVCKLFAAKLRSVPSALLEINDPQLYKAVTGRLELMISSRMHPLILAASMGTPIVGLAYNSKFDGLFDLLQLPQRPLWLNRIEQIDLSKTIHTLAFDALNQKEALRTRSAQLANMVAQSTRELLDGN